MNNETQQVREYTFVKNEHDHIELKEISCKTWNGDLERNRQIADMLCKLFYMDRLVVEKAYVVAFDSDMKIKGVLMVGQGMETWAPVSIKQMIRFLLVVDAAQFIFVHNHPNGNAESSKNDDDVAKALQQASDLFRIDFIGSMIIGGAEWYVHDGLIEKKREMIRQGKSFESFCDCFDEILEYYPDGRMCASIDGIEVTGTVEELIGYINEET